MGFQIGFPALRNYPPLPGGGGGYDADAQDYIDRVEAADGQALETTTRDAMNQLVLDLKASSYWPLVDYALPGSGARTLAGGLVPLQNTTASTDVGGGITWNRKNGFTTVGNSHIELPLNENDSGTLNDGSMSAWIVEKVSNVNAIYFGGVGSRIQRRNAGDQARFRSRNENSNIDAGPNTDSSLGFRGINRVDGTQHTYRVGGIDTTVSVAATDFNARQLRIFEGGDGVLPCPSGTGVAWVHVGDSLTLATLEAIVTDYRNAINAAF